MNVTTAILGQVPLERQQPDWASLSSVPMRESPRMAATRIAVRVVPTSLYRLYRRRRIASLVARYTPRVVTHVYGEFELLVELRDGLAEGWYDHDWQPLPELQILKERGLSSGSLVFDIGAHYGVVALMVAKMIGSEGRVIALEAEPHNARAAERNRALNGADNVTVIAAAGAERPGTVRFAEGLNGRVRGAGDCWGTIEVPAMTVDQLAQRYGDPDIVIVDVEGHEGWVLDGAQATIASQKTTFLIEVHVGHGLDREPQSIAAYFAEGYRCLAAPEFCEPGAFGAYTPQSDVNFKRFYLVAAPVAGRP